MTTLKDLLEDTFYFTGDKIENLQFVVHVHRNETHEDAVARCLDEQIVSNYGGSSYTPFTAYSENFVYWMGEYDGACNIEFVPRNPTHMIKLGDTSDCMDARSGNRRILHNGKLGREV